jgi:hypothetical protein
LTTEARNEARKHQSNTKFQTYGGYIQYGVTDNLDIGLHGNSSINPSIGIHAKYRPAKKLATMVGFDYIMNEMVLAPFGTLMTGTDISKNVTVYGGVKAFQWSNMIIKETPRDSANTFGTILFAGVHIFRKEGWKNQSILSSLPTGLYIEVAYPVNVDSKCVAIVLGLDGFLGLSFPRLQWP